MSNLKRSQRSSGKPPKVRVGLCCNDPDNGTFADKVSGIEISGKASRVELEPSRCVEPKLTILDGKLRIFRRTFAFDASQDWVGNWCWNEYRMSIGDAAAFLSAALEFGFTATGAEGNAACALTDMCDEFQEWDVGAMRDQILKMTLES